MKKALVFFVSFILPVLVSAQNWSPFNATDRFHYNTDNSELITSTIYVDSTEVIGSDTIYYFNRIVARCDTCIPTDYGLPEWFCDTCLYLKNQPQFAMRQVQISANNIWTFSDTLTFTLIPKASIDSAWTFSSFSNATATIDSLFVTDIFDIPDSIKRIHISSGANLFLSKNHGLVSVPFVGQNHMLVGISGPDLGERPPGFSEIFNFEVGDELEYKHQSYGGAITSFGSSRIVITNVFISTDSVKIWYDVVGNHFSYWYWYSWDLDEFYYSEPGSASFAREDYIFLESAPKEFISILDGTFSGYCDYYGCGKFSSMLFHTDNRGFRYFGGIILFNESVGFNSSDFLDQGPVHYEIDGIESSIQIGINASEFDTGTNYGDFKSYAFGEGLGLVTQYVYTGNGLAQGAEWMVGWIKDGDTTGTITPSNILLGTENLDQEISMNIYPNPATDFVYIQNQLKGEISLKIYDQLGKVITNENHDNNNMLSIDVSDLPAGLYIIELSQKGISARSKLLIE